MKTPGIDEGPSQDREPAGLPDREPITVVTADIQPLIQRGVASVLAKEMDIRVVAQFSTVSETLAGIQKLQPDVAILGFMMIGGGAFDVLAALPGTSTRTRTIILASEMTPIEFTRAHRLGVRGVLLTRMPAEMVARSVRTVHRGGEFVEKSIVLRTFHHLMRDSHAHRELHKLLTARELATVTLVTSGLSNKQIARELRITEGTVKLHLHRSYEKLGVRGRMGLVLHRQTQDEL